MIGAKAKQQELESKSMGDNKRSPASICSLNSIDSPHYFVQQIKAMSANPLRKEFPELKRLLPTLWTRNYYAESIRHISEKSIKNM